MMLLPCFGKVGNNTVDFILGTDVDTSGRLIQDQDIRIVCQPAADQHFLLVAAGQRSNRCLAGRCLGIHLFDIVLNKLFNLLGVKNDAVFYILIQ